MHGARVFAETLEASGVEYAFGLPGSVNLGLIDEMEQNGIPFVTTRHEHTAAGMATGYTMATRRPSVSISHVGPGAANQIIGIASAYRENVPVISVTGNEPSYLLGKGVHHEWDVVDIFERFTKHNTQVTEPQFYDRIRDTVLRSVSGVPGPVHIDIPSDFEDKELDSPSQTTQEKLAARDLRASVSRAEPADEDVAAAVEAIERAERPVVIAGSELRWFGGTDELRAVAEAIDVPVANDHNARGALPETHPLSLGLVGRLGLDVTNDYLREADLIVAVGTRLSDYCTDDWTLISDEQELVHVTLRERDLDRHYVADVGILADVQSSLRKLSEALGGADLSFRDVAEPARRAYVDRREEFLEPGQHEGGEGVDTRKLVRAVDETLDEYTFVTGGGIHAKLVRHLPVEDLNGNFGTLNFSGMSQGLPLGLGAQLALDQQVVVFEGDGGFAMVMQDLETAVRESIPVKVIIVNNNAYMSQKVRQQDRYDERYTGTEYANPDFGNVAEEFGMYGDRVTDDDRVEEAVTRLFEQDGPGVLDVQVDPWIGTELLSS